MTTRWRRCLLHVSDDTAWTEQQQGGLPEGLARGRPVIRSAVRRGGVIGALNDSPTPGTVPTFHSLQGPSPEVASRLKEPADDIPLPPPQVSPPYHYHAPISFHAHHAPSLTPSRPFLAVNPPRRPLLVHDAMSSNRSVLSPAVPQPPKLQGIRFGSR